MDSAMDFVVDPKKGDPHPPLYALTLMILNMILYHKTVDKQWEVLQLCVRSAFDFWRAGSPIFTGDIIKVRPDARRPRGSKILTFGNERRRSNLHILRFTQGSQPLADGCFEQNRDAWWHTHFSDDPDFHIVAGIDNLTVVNGDVYKVNKYLVR